MTEILVKVKSFKPDRTQWKHYDISYEPENMWVSVNLPDEEVIENKDNVVLTTAGLQTLVGLLANVADAIDAEHIKKYK